jgi:hypothetical protein
LKLALDENHTALAEVFRDKFGRPAPSRTVEKISFANRPHYRFLRVFAIHRQAERQHAYALPRRFKLQIVRHSPR